jgi:hypothetical protein
MRIKDRTPTSFSGVKLAKTGYCQKSSQDLIDEYLRMDDTELNPERIASCIINNSGIGLLPRERRKLGYYVLHSDFDEFNPKFCEIVLKKFSGAHGFWTQLFHAWLFYYDVESKAGLMVREVLARKKRFLNDASLEINLTFDVLSKREHRNDIVEKILNRNISRQSLDSIKFSTDGISGGKFANALVSDIAKFCMTKSLTADQIMVVLELISHQGIVHESIREFALVSLIYGIKSHNKESQHYIKSKEVIDKNFQDPRIHENTWPMISEGLGGKSTRDFCIDTVKQWHIFQSIQLFFKIIEKVVDEEYQHQFPQRRDFWIDYFNKGMVSDAWVILGNDGLKEARRYKMSGDPDFASLEWAQLNGASSSQCILLMRIGEVSIMEWSHSGACRVWKQGDSNAPSFSKRRYEKGELMRKVSIPDLDRIVHDKPGRWKDKIRTRVNAYSGLRRFL